MIKWLLNEWEGRTWKCLALVHDSQSSLCLVHTSGSRAKYFPVQTSHSFSKYVVSAGPEPFHLIYRIYHSTWDESCHSRDKPRICVIAHNMETFKILWSSNSWRQSICIILIPIRHNCRWSFKQKYCFLRSFCDVYCERVLRHNGLLTLLWCRVLWRSKDSPAPIRLSFYTLVIWQ